MSAWVKNRLGLSPAGKKLEGPVDWRTYGVTQSSNVDVSTSKAETPKRSYRHRCVSMHTPLLVLHCITPITSLEDCRSVPVTSVVQQTETFKL
eukprot:4992963-Pyramimonas_sp.AAC.1